MERYEKIGWSAAGGSCTHTQSVVSSGFLVQAHPPVLTCASSNEPGCCCSGVLHGHAIAAGSCSCGSRRRRRWRKSGFDAAGNRLAGADAAAAAAAGDAAVVRRALPPRPPPPQRATAAPLAASMVTLLCGRNHGVVSLGDGELSAAIRQKLHRCLGERLGSAYLFHNSIIGEAGQSTDEPDNSNEFAYNMHC